MPNANGNNGGKAEWNGEQQLDNFPNMIAQRLRVNKDDGRRSCSGSLVLYDGGFKRDRQFLWQAVYNGDGRWEITGQAAGEANTGRFDRNESVNYSLKNFVQDRLIVMRKEKAIFCSQPKPSQGNQPKPPVLSESAPAETAAAESATPAPPGPEAELAAPLPPLQPPPAPLPPPAPEPAVPVAAPKLVAQSASAIELLCEEIEPWPDQPRTQFKKQPLVELAESMGGLQQVLPILVRPFKAGEVRLNSKSKYQIVDGERRWRAAMLNRAVTIGSIIVHPKDIVEQHRMSVIANLHREQHSHYELARAVIFQYSHGRSVVEITADFSKKSRAWAYMYLVLKELAPELFELINPTVGREKQLPFQHALILARVKKERQAAILEQAKREGNPQGPRGVLLRLQELAEENLSDTGQSGRKRKRDFDHAARTVDRAMASVKFNTRAMLEMAGRLKTSSPMRDPAARAAVAARAREAAEALIKFSELVLQ